MLTLGKHLEFLRSCNTVCNSGRLWRRGNLWFWITWSGASSSTFIPGEILLTVWKYNLTPDFSVTDHSDRTSLPKAAAAGGLAASPPRAELAQRDCCNEPMQDWHLLRNAPCSVFIRYECFAVLYSGPGKSMRCILVGTGSSSEVCSANRAVEQRTDRDSPSQLCRSPTDSQWLRVETRDRSSQVRTREHLVHIYPEEFASDTNCSGWWGEGVYFSSIFRLGTVPELEVIN